MPVDKNTTKQIGVTLPLTDYQKIIVAARQLGGIAPSALLRAILYQATDNLNDIRLRDSHGLPMARKALELSPIDFEGRMEKAVDDATAAMVERLLPTLREQAREVIEQQAQEANAQAIAAEPELMAAFNPHTDDWDDYVPPTQGKATTEGSWFRET